MKQFFWLKFDSSKVFMRWAGRLIVLFFGLGIFLMPHFSFAATTYPYIPENDIIIGSQYYSPFSSSIPPDSNLYSVNLSSCPNILINFIEPNGMSATIPVIALGNQQFYFQNDPSYDLSQISLIDATGNSTISCGSISFVPYTIPDYSFEPFVSVCTVMGATTECRNPFWDFFVFAILIAGFIWIAYKISCMIYD